MNWKNHVKGEGEFIIAFENTANGMRGFKHVEIVGDEMFEPGQSAQGAFVFLGPHIRKTGWLKLTYPRKK